jgi:hypothetical protein
MGFRAFVRVTSSTLPMMRQGWQGFSALARRGWSLLQVTRSSSDTQGTGPLYQGRFKAFPVAKDEHCLRVLRYVERNPLRAGLA